MDVKAPRRTPESVNRLKAPEQYKFYKWFEETEFGYGVADSYIATLASTTLGFTVTVGNVAGAWDATGKRRAKAPVDGEAKIQILKRHLEYLTVILSKYEGAVLPPEWADL